MADLHEPKRAKFTYLTGKLKNKSFDVHFNPESLQLAITNSIDKKGKGKKTKQFVSQSSAKLSMELVFDTTDTGKDARVYTEKVARLMEPDEKKTPPICKFEWGLYAFQGMVEGYKETIDFFSGDGVPLRATISLTLVAQDAVFAESKKGSAKTAGSLAGSNETVQVPQSKRKSLSDTASKGGDPKAARDLGLFNGEENLRFPSGKDLHFSESFELKPPAAFTTGGSGFGASAGAGFGVSGGLGFGASAGAGFGFSGGGGFGLSGGGGFGISGGAGFGISGGAGFGLSGGAGFGLSGGAGFGISGGFGASGSAGLGFGASGGVSGAVAASAGASGTSATGTMSAAAGASSTGFAASGPPSAQGPVPPSGQRAAALVPTPSATRIAHSARGFTATTEVRSSVRSPASGEDTRQLEGPSFGGRASAGVPARFGAFAGLRPAPPRRRQPRLQARDIRPEPEDRDLGTQSITDFEIGGRARTFSPDGLTTEVGQSRSIAQRIRFDED